MSADSASPPAEADGSGEGFSIQAASEILNVPAPTIRSWERRYRLPTHSRGHGRHRRYSERDLAVLRRMRDETSRGVRAVDAAAMVNASIDASPTTLAAEVVTAAQRLDARAINDVFTHAHAVLGLDAAIDDVVLPALREIGDRWQRGHLDISHEHLCTVATQAWLSEVHQSFPPPTRPSPVILSCGPRDVHTLGLDCMVVLLSRRGWDCRVLGARTPVGSLSLAVRQLDAAAVIVVSHLASARPAAVEAIRSLSTTKVAVFFAGSAFGSRQSRLDLPGTYLGEGMAQAADLVTSRADPRC